MVFRIASSPYTHNQRQTSRIMLHVILATLPGIAVQCYVFGWGTLIQLVLAISCALLAETIILRLRAFPVRPVLTDNSALLTGLLLAVSIPPLVPWWIVVTGILFAIVIAKQLYGGLGNNPFNPAMVGYVVLLISFPVQMTGWQPPHNLSASTPDFMDSVWLVFTGHNQSEQTLTQLRVALDGISQATPLDSFKTGLRSGHSTSQLLHIPMLSGWLAGIGWQWVNLAYLAGGIYLLARKVIRWHIPVSFLASLLVCSVISWLLAPQNFPPPALHLFSGASMLGAFFILTDPVTAATTRLGRLIFGALAGLLVWLIRSFGGYPDAVAFATLLVNILVPLIDYYTRPTIYGQR